MNGRTVLFAAVCVVVALGVLGTPAAATEAPDVVVNETYGGTGDDGVNQIIETKDGNYLLVGAEDGYPIDAFAMKVTPDGTRLWKRSFGGEGNDSLWGAVRTPDGGYALVGFTESTSSGDSDGWLLKTDGDGNMQWESTYGGQQTDRLYDVAVTPDGGFLLVGRTVSDDTGNDAWVVKTASDGSRTWEEEYWSEARDGYEIATGIERTPSGTYLISGQEYIDDEHWDGVAFEIDRTGELRWRDRYGHPVRNDFLNDVAVADSGQAYFVGGRNAAWNSSADDYESGDAWVRSVDPSRDTLWSTTVSVADITWFSRADADSDAVLAAGHVRANVNSEATAFAAVVNRDGTESWNLTTGGQGVDDFDAALVGTDEYYVAGETNSVGDGDLQAWLLKLNGHTSDSWFSNYVDESGVVDSSGLNTAVMDYLQGELDDSQLNTVVLSYLSGTPPGNR